MIFYEFDTWIIPDAVRYIVGLPSVVIGLSVVCYSVSVLGLKNTYGLKDGFIDKPPYSYTRNPQYVGDIVMIFGLMLFVNSFDMVYLFLLSMMIFIIMPFAEESWLVERYTDKYIRYKNKTVRFI